MNGSGTGARRRRTLAKQQLKSQQRARFQSRHPYAAVAVTGVAYLAILGGIVDDLVRGASLGTPWALYGAAGFAAAAGLARLAAVARRRGWRARNVIGACTAVIGLLSLNGLRLTFPRPPYDGAQQVFGVDLHAALLGYALVAVTAYAALIARTVPRARALRALGPAGQAREGGFPVRARFTDWEKTRNWHHGFIRIAGGEIAWHSAGGSRVVSCTEACRELAASPPRALFRRRTVVSSADERILVDVHWTVLAALARDLDQRPQALPDPSDPAY